MRSARQPDAVEAIAFDLYGTLFDVGSLSETAAAVAPGAPTELVDLWRRIQLEYTWLRALMGRYEDFWLVTSDALDDAATALRFQLDARAHARLMDGWLGLRPWLCCNSPRRTYHTFVVTSGGSAPLARFRLPPRRCERRGRRMVRAEMVECRALRARCRSP